MNTLKRLGMQLLAGVLLATAVAAPASAQSPAPEDDWAKVKAAGKILVGTAADYPPFEFYASNYQLDGFDIQLMKEIGKRLGIEVEFNDFAFEGVLDALRLKQVDAAIAGISVTDDRRALVDFSNIYYIGKDAALIRSADQGSIKTEQDLAGKKIGVQRGTTFQAWVQDHLVDPGLVPQANVISYANVDAMVTDLRERKTDVVIMGESPARVYDRRFRDIIVGITGVNPQRFAIASRNGSTLSNQFNSALLQIQSDGTFAKLVDQYLNVDPKDVTAGNEGQVVNEQPGTGGETTPACINGMAFVADVNLDDKNMTAPPVMKPNQQFTKTWRVRNSGTCAWDPKFVLAYSYGNRPEAQMGGTQVAVGKAVQPGETVDISANLTAPNVYGVFQGFWTMRDLQNVEFGETVWVGIQVPNPNPPPPPTAPPPPPRPPAVLPTAPPNVNMTGPNLRADSQYINAGQCTTIRWEVGNVKAVYFVTGNNVEGVGGVDSRVVCPPATTTYVLRVVRQDNVVQDFPITINVQQPNATINFWADSYSIQPGQCTTVRWDVQGVQAVFYNEQGVAGQDARQECPSQTTTYNLRVVLNDGSQQTRQVTIQVVGGGFPTPIP